MSDPSRGAMCSFAWVYRSWDVTYSIICMQLNVNSTPPLPPITGILVRSPIPSRPLRSLSSESVFVRWMVGVFSRCCAMFRLPLPSHLPYSSPTEWSVKTTMLSFGRSLVVFSHGSIPTPAGWSPLLLGVEQGRFGMIDQSRGRSRRTGTPSGFVEGIRVVRCRSDH